MIFIFIIQLWNLIFLNHPWTSRPGLVVLTLNAASIRYRLVTKPTPHVHDTFLPDVDSNSVSHFPFGKNKKEIKIK